jgi:chromosome segregation ATPase
MFATQEQYDQAEAELKQIEAALENARAQLAEAQQEKEKVSQFYNAFVARWNAHKAHFSYLPVDDLREWAIKDHEFELEKKVIDRRFNEADQRVEKLKEEVRANDASRATRVRDLQLMKMPDGKAYHLQRMENKLRGL